MKKILFLHGFYASGQCIPAIALRESFAGRADVLTPDLPMHPQDALRFIRELIDREKPDLHKCSLPKNAFCQIPSGKMEII